MSSEVISGLNPTQGAVQIVVGAVGEREPTDERAFAQIERNIYRPKAMPGEGGARADPRAVRQCSNEARLTRGKDAHGAETVTRRKSGIIGVPWKKQSI